MSDVQWGLIFWFSCVVLVLVPAIVFVVIFHQSDKEKKEQKARKG